MLSSTPGCFGAERGVAVCRLLCDRLQQALDINNRAFHNVAISRHSFLLIAN
jgi:hypothetical protein